MKARKEWCGRAVGRKSEAQGGRNVDGREEQMGMEIQVSNKMVSIVSPGSRSQSRDECVTT